LLAHPAVVDVAVVGLTDRQWGRRVHAIVELQPGTDPAGMDENLRAREGTPCFLQGTAQLRIRR
jgi:acyl-coenzyme A synthetase/AMP-(fatty) acid ligase